MYQKYVEENVVNFIRDFDRRTETFDNHGCYVLVVKKPVGEFTDVIFCGVTGYHGDEFSNLNSVNLRFCGLYSYKNDTLITHNDFVKMRGFTQYNTYKQWMSAKVNDMVGEIVDGKPVSEEDNKPEHNLPEIDDGTVEAKAVFCTFPTNLQARRMAWSGIFLQSWFEMRISYTRSTKELISGRVKLLRRM